MECNNNNLPPEVWGLILNTQTLNRNDLHRAMRVNHEFCGLVQDTTHYKVGKFYAWVNRVLTDCPNAAFTLENKIVDAWKASCEKYFQETAQGKVISLKDFNKSTFSSNIDLFINCLYKQGENREHPTLAPLLNYGNKVPSLLLDVLDEEEIVLMTQQHYPVSGIKRKRVQSQDVTYVTHLKCKNRKFSEEENKSVSLKKRNFELSDMTQFASLFPTSYIEGTTREDVEARLHAAMASNPRASVVWTLRPSQSIAGQLIMSAIFAPANTIGHTILKEDSKDLISKYINDPQVKLLLDVENANNLQATYNEQLSEVDIKRRKEVLEKEIQLLDQQNIILFNPNAKRKNAELFLQENPDLYIIRFPSKTSEKESENPDFVLSLNMIGDIQHLSVVIDKTSGKLLISKMLYENLQAFLNSIESAKLLSIIGIDDFINSNANK